jgi:hypothetical protein
VEPTVGVPLRDTVAGTVSTRGTATATLARVMVV